MTLPAPMSQIIRALKRDATPLRRVEASPLIISFRFLDADIAGAVRDVAAEDATIRRIAETWAPRKRDPDWRPGRGCA